MTCKRIFIVIISINLIGLIVVFSTNDSSFLKNYFRNSKPNANESYMTFHHLMIDEDSSNISKFYFAQATNERNSSYPFISGDTFRAMADFVFDETRQDNLSLVKYGDVVFLKGDMLEIFFNGSYQSISNRFVLVSHNSDMSVPREHYRYLKDEKILVWYASNPDVKNEKKLVPIPIGLNNQYWPMGRLSQIEHAFRHYRKFWHQRTNLLYANFLLRNNLHDRFYALRYTKRVEGNRIVRSKISLDHYLQDIGNAKFVVSPAGSGLDCHRTWETLLMGGVPIVVSSTLDPLFRHIPVLIIKRWSDLDIHLLSSFKSTNQDERIPSILYARYWRKRFRDHRFSHISQ